MRQSLLVAAVFCIAAVPLCSTHVEWDDFMRCLQRRFGRSFFQEEHADCAARKLFVNYRRSMYCEYCDAFFHCQGNYEAIYECQRDGRAQEVAEAFSDCREHLEGAGSDNLVYNEIDLFGRKGGNCSRAYLSNSPHCHYNPATVVCNNTRIEEPDISSSSSSSSSAADSEQDDV
ncbi:uncharacterized protein LOC144173279 [Haemaphysalis longicornis]|uniref:Uncharacterized protein n=1 Tax=Haemaphysalis longicornis TaxID=44386 RepID=A0A9J6GG19_HAELO|nr:hypothetical protein HPB48_007495 [Haemaphysalis longicornis]